MEYIYTYTRTIPASGDIGKFRGAVFNGGHLSTQYLGDVKFTPDEFGDAQPLIQRVKVQATSNAYDNCWAVPGSGNSISYDDLLDLPVGSGASDAVDLFAVKYPYYVDGVYKYNYLVCKAYRSDEYPNRTIGSTGKAGTYINVELRYYKRSGEQASDEEDYALAASTSRVYKANTYDVTDSEINLEFFYASQTQSSWDDNEHQLFVGISNRVVTTGGLYKLCDYELWAPRMFGAQSFEIFFGRFSPESYEYSEEYGYESETGGYTDGSHDLSSDDIDHSGPPSLSVLSPGFVNIYRVNTGLLTNLGRALFPQNLLSMDATGLSDAQVILKSFRYLIDTQQNKGAIDYIIDCHIVPVNVPTSGTANITAGGKVLKDPDAEHPLDPLYGTPYPAPVVTETYVTKSCGSVTIPEAYGNFLDYTVRCKLYLPFYGYVDIPAEYWNGGTLSVEYMFNIYDGSFVAFVKGKAKHSNLNSLIGQYAGSACTHIPVSGRDYSQMVSGLMSAGIGTIATAMTGGAGGIVAGVGAMGSGLANVLSMKQPMISNGSSNSSSAMMMHKKPYLIIEYPTPQFSGSYPRESGLPLNVSNQLGYYGGMTIAENPVLDGIPCTEREKERIREALRSGLIFR